MYIELLVVIAKSVVALQELRLGSTYLYFKCRCRSFSSQQSFGIENTSSSTILHNRIKRVFYKETRASYIALETSYVRPECIQCNFEICLHILLIFSDEGAFRRQP